MAKGVTIPLTIPGLKAAKADLAKVAEEIKGLDKNSKDYVKNSQRLAKEFNTLSKAIDGTTDELLDLNKAGKLAGTRFDDLQETLFGVNEEVLPLTSQIGEMEDRMYQLSAAGQAGNTEFIALQKETARLRRVIIETDKSVDLLAENSGLGVFAEGWASIGGSIARLDFKGAEQGAERLQGAMGNMTTIAKGGMKSLAKTVGILGKSFVKFGLTILMNPLFLLVAVVTAIVVALVTLKDKVAFIGAIFEAIAIPIRAVIQWLKDFLDWIGITSFAEDEAAAAREAQNAKELEDLKKLEAANKKRNETAQRQTAIALEAIDLAKEKAKLEGANAEELEKFDQQALDAKLNQLKTDREVAAKQLQINADKIKAEATRALNAAKSAKAGSTEQNKALSRAEFRFKKHQKQLALIKSGGAASLKEIDQQIERATIESQKRTEDEAQANREERRSKYEEFAANRLSALRSIQDLENSLMAEGIDKELALLNTKFDREIEDTIANEKLKQKEKDEIVKLLESQRAAKEGKLLLETREKEEEEARKKAEKERKFKEDAENSALAQIEQFQEAAYQLTLTDQEREEGALRDKYTNQLALAEQYGQDTTSIKEAQLKEEQALEDKYAKIAKKKKQAETEAKANIAISGLQLVADVASLFANRSEKAAKLAFNVQKAASIAQATMDGYKAVLSTYAQTPGGPVIKGIAAGIAGGFSAVQIAKIASSKFEGGGGTVSASVPSGGVGGGGATSSTASAPSFELFGQANDFNNVEGAESAEQTINVNAVVSEVEMTEAQTTVSNIQQSATL